VPPRAYNSERRAEQARRTRRRVLDAAADAFRTSGYTAATLRGIATAAGVSVPTVEQSFGTKARLLMAAIDVAIAGDDEQIPVLERDWVARADAAPDPEAFLQVTADVLAAAQERSAGLVLAVFEGGAGDPDLAALAAELTRRRLVTAGWAVDRLAARATLRDPADARDTFWALMDPALFTRLTRHRGWSIEHYARWFARTATRLLLKD